MASREPFFLGGGDTSNLLYQCMQGETDMGWLPGLLEDIYSNEVKHCTNSTVKGEEETSETPQPPVISALADSGNLGYLFQGYFTFCHPFHLLRRRDATC